MRLAEFVRSKAAPIGAYLEDLELHTLELRKFSENAEEELIDIVAKVRNSLDVWMAFLTRHDLLNKERLPEVLDKPALKKALDVLEVMNFSAEEREAYEDHLKWLRIEANTLKKYQTIGFDEGKIAGINEVAKALLADGMEVTKISHLTGLSVKEIESLD